VTEEIVATAQQLAEELGEHGVKELLEVFRNSKRPCVASVDFHLGPGHRVDLEVTTTRKVLDPRRSGR